LALGMAPHAVLAKGARPIPRGELSPVDSSTTWGAWWSNGHRASLRCWFTGSPSANRRLLTEAVCRALTSHGRKRRLNGGSGGSSVS
ncbi:hypothetical protein, partial [Pseudomonas syringae group sp. J309-1]|uniref:hypothetical protein n=1 Tax=Pseudomonas syringae group sp. J309-1 TaxID=3079588 RepID=UPI00290BADDE